MVLAKLISFFRTFIKEVREGLKYGYPICCVLEYAFDSARGMKHIALKKGAIIKDGKIQDYVPCFIHRRLYKRITFEEKLQMLNPNYVVKLSVINDIVRITYTPKVRCSNCGKI